MHGTKTSLFTRRPTNPEANPVQTFCQCWVALSVTGRGATIIVSVLLGLALPVMGISLAVFIMIDWLRWRVASNMPPVESIR